MMAAGWSAGRFSARLRAALGLAVAPAFIALPAAAQSLRAFPPPFEIRVPVPPGPLASGGDHYLVYELLIKSFMPAPAEVSRVEVFAESPAGRRLLEYAGEELGENMLPPTSQEEDPVKRRTIGALSHGVVYVMLPISGSVTMPRQLFGRSAFAQRYAIDYMLVDAEGRAMPVEDGDNDTYPGYGEEVIAVADGVISTVFDGVPENTPGVTSRPEVFNLSTAIGNHVILDLGNGRYVLYAHLLPGSPQVRVGQQVRRGDVLGRVGNSGNSGGAHLHFHIIDDNVPLGAEGLPFVHDAFELVGMCHEGPGGPCEMSEPELRQYETPMRNQLIRFPG